MIKKNLLPERVKDNSCQKELTSILWHCASKLRRVHVSRICLVSALRNLILIMHGIQDYLRLSVKRQGAHLKSLEKQRRAWASRDGREARREILRDRSSPRVRRHYFCWPLHLNAILSAWAKYVIYGSRVSRTTEGFTALGTQGHPSGGPPRGIFLPYRCVCMCKVLLFLEKDLSWYQNSHVN